MNKARTLQRHADLRGLRWPLEPLQRNLDMALERARLALAALQARERLLQGELLGRQSRQEQQQRWAAECLRRDPRLRGPVLGYLATVEDGIARVREDVGEAQRQLAAARADCVARQRQLACVQELRGAAERAHAQAQLRRQAREADAAWLARRSAARRPSGGTPE